MKTPVWTPDTLSAWLRRYVFSDFTLDTDAHVLSCAGHCVDIEPQVFDLLRNAGQLVTRDAMIAEVWSGRIVSDLAISARIAAARRAVGDTGKDQAIIQTIQRRGLKFVAPLAHQAAIPTVRPMQPPVRYTCKGGTGLAYLDAGQGLPILRVPHFPTHIERD